MTHAPLDDRAAPSIAPPSAAVESAMAKLAETLVLVNASVTQESRRRVDEFLRSADAAEPVDVVLVAEVAGYVRAQRVVLNALLEAMQVLQTPEFLEGLASLQHITPLIEGAVAENAALRARLDAIGAVVSGRVPDVMLDRATEALGRLPIQPNAGVRDYARSMLGAAVGLG